ncbi:winged helix DNA-binding domain-containing protein [Ruania suaedae]|uniref:DNA glycosylase AlkZ-like family protein n=1 Tax=Ruania suaedae TaxID=2897774 RepID=UPI001E4AF564|nr:crosslink repair DNA glycosylase YcaQ family protein [Ruania suaedae]UFU03652.1 winged helix DNA-binding domain-containing protein [Ruania suaedae]
MATTWAAALGWRLRRHYLGEERAGSVEAVVDRLIAVPSWSGDAATAIGLRLAQPAHGDPAAALAQQRLIATYAFRGTTHVMTPASASIHLSLRCAGRQWERSSWREHYRLEPEDWPRLRATVREALAEGPLTQQELAAAVTADPAYRHLAEGFTSTSHTLLKPFGWQGDLCLRPSDGVLRFQLLESLPGWTGLVELDEAGPLAIRAYLAAYGPATRDRLHYWLGEGLSAGRRRIETWLTSPDAGVATITVGGEEALCVAEDAEAITGAEASDRIVLLPGADQWVLGAGTSDTHIVPAAHRQAATRGSNLVLVGGRVQGTWTVNADVIRVHWFDAPDSSAPLTLAAEELAQVLGRPLLVEEG